MHKYIQLNLSSQFASFGGSTSTAERVSDNMPSRSLIEGILSCLFGIKRDDSTKLQEVHDNLVEYGGCIKQFGNKISDYQIIQKSRSCGGERKNEIEFKKGSTIANKEYYTDNYCVVLLKIQESFFEKVEERLNNPIWQPYIGRKCNTIYKYFYDNETKTYKKWFEIIRTSDTIQDVLMKIKGTVFLESEPVNISCVKKTIRGIRNYSLKDRFFNEQNIYIVNSTWENVIGLESKNDEFSLHIDNE